MSKLRSIITENEAQTLELYLEREEINKRFKIVPMRVLKQVIEKGIEKGLNITTIADSVGLAFVTVYHQYNKINSKHKDCERNPHKLVIDKVSLKRMINEMKTKSKMELSVLLEKKFGKFVSYSTVCRLLKENEIEL